MYMILSAYINANGFTGLRPGDAKRLTHVNFSFALVRDGKASVAHWKNPETIRAFVKERGHIKALLSMGGWGAGGFSPAVATAESREIFAQSYADIINDYGFDGGDLDWEYPGVEAGGIEQSPDDTQNFTLFMQLLRDKLGPDKLLTMAAGASESCVKGLEIDKLVNIMDFINIMTYDMCPQDSVGHHTALYPSKIAAPRCADSALKLFHDAGVPWNQLTLGGAFYARVYKDTDGLGSAAAEFPPGFAGGYPGIIKKAHEAGGMLFDDDAKAPYIYDKTERAFYTFDDERSLRAKRAYALEKGLKGCMFWEYSCDGPDSPLLKAFAGE
jgi:chitinase